MWDLFIKFQFFCLRLPCFFSWPFSSSRLSSWVVVLGSLILENKIHRYPRNSGFWEVQVHGQETWKGESGRYSESCRRWGLSWVPAWCLVSQQHVRQLELVIPQSLSFPLSAPLHDHPLLSFLLVSRHLPKSDTWRPEAVSWSFSLLHLHSHSLQGFIWAYSLETQVSLQPGALSWAQDSAPNCLSHLRLEV